MSINSNFLFKLGTINTSCNLHQAKYLYNPDEGLLEDVQEHKY